VVMVEALAYDIGTYDIITHNKDDGKRDAM
jgi:hypothetical protein